jgi:hypothetical protein
MIDDALGSIIKVDLQVDTMMGIYKAGMNETACLTKYQQTDRG